MKKITYDLDSMKKIGELLGKLTLQGIDNIKIVAIISEFLDSGEIIDDQEGGGKDDNTDN